MPSREEFFKDYENYYFQNQKNKMGRCFHIQVENEFIGQINYNNIENNEVEIDILIYDKNQWNKGFGSSAIKILSSFLHEKYHIDNIFIETYADNERAIHTYEKVGFVKNKKLKDENGNPYWKLILSLDT